MRDYFARRYAPSNMVLAFAGKSRWEDLLSMASRMCGGWSGPAASREAIPPRGTKSFRGVLRAEDSQQTTIAMADGPELESDERYAAALLAAIIGDQTGSRMYWDLIDPGHADGAWFAFQEYNRGGMFFSMLSCDPENTEANLARIREIMRSVAERGVTEDELTRAKNKVLARSVIRGERPMGRLTSLGFQWIYRHSYLTVEEEIDAYMRVTSGEIAAIVERWPLWPATIVSVGPLVDPSRPD
jgi:predicted Zn-dependent peptidase